MFNFIVFKILLFKGGTVLGPTQHAPGSERVLKFVKAPNIFKK